jgi:hypothetical protein
MIKTYTFTFSSAQKEYFFFDLILSFYLHEQKLQWCLLHMWAIRAQSIRLPKQVGGADIARLTQG